MFDTKKIRIITDYTAACKVVGAHLGYTGKSGGWIYDAAGKRICQGWSTLASRKNWTKLGIIRFDVDIRKHIVDLNRA